MQYARTHAVWDVAAVVATLPAPRAAPGRTAVWDSVSESTGPLAHPLSERGRALRKSPTCAHDLSALDPSALCRVHSHRSAPPPPPGAGPPALERLGGSEDSSSGSSGSSGCYGPSGSPGSSGPTPTFELFRRKYPLVREAPRVAPPMTAPLAQGRSPGADRGADRDRAPGEREGAPRAPAPVRAETSAAGAPAIPPWPATFLPKSSSFLKACRRAGRRGRVLARGWVACRAAAGAAWEDVARCPARTDFRYLLLLEDAPALYLFASRPRPREPASRDDLCLGLFRDCLSLDVREGLSVRVAHVSRELGTEVRLVDAATRRPLYGLLPVRMPGTAFLDAHSSRLAKGAALGQVFPPRKSAASLRDEKAREQHESVQREQNDVARHLLFVLDGAIRQR